jgi:hypothetical protein
MILEEKTAKTKRILCTSTFCEINNTVCSEMEIIPLESRPNMKTFTFLLSPVCDTKKRNCDEIFMT